MGGRPQLASGRNRVGIRKRILVAGLAMCGVVVAGTVGYMILARAHPLDALYMTVITLSTVGFGEVVELNPVGRAFTILLILGGMGTLLYGVSSLTAFIVEGELKDILRRRKMEKRIAALRNHYVVCGVEGAGRYVVQELKRTGHDFVVVDEDAKRIDALQGEGELLWVEGDPTDDDVLRRAGLENASGLVTTLDNDKDNLYVVLSARGMNPGLRIVSLAVQEDCLGKLRRAGANEVVSPNSIGGLRIASVLIRPAVVTFLDKMLRFRDVTLRIEEVNIPEGSKAVGKTLAEINVGQAANAVLLAIRHKKTGEYEYNPSLDHQVEAGDVLIVLGEVDRVARLEKSLAA